MKPRILVVEDDKAIRELLVEFLSGEGFETHAATNGQMALDLLRAGTPPDLILLDLMMPIKDGLQFCAEQQQSAALAGIPVVIMSADPHIVQKQAQTRARGFIKKPLDIDDLLKMVRSHGLHAPLSSA